MLALSTWRRTRVRLRRRLADALQWRIALAKLTSARLRGAWPARRWVPDGVVNGTYQEADRAAAMYLLCARGVLTAVLGGGCVACDGAVDSLLVAAHLMVLMDDAVSMRQGGRGSTSAMTAPFDTANITSTWEVTLLMILLAKMVRTPTTCGASPVF